MSERASWDETDAAVNFAAELAGVALGYRA